MTGIAPTQRVRRFSRSERAVHWALAAAVLAMIATGIALGVNVWHGVAFPIHVGSVFVLVAGVYVIAIVGDPAALRRAGGQLSRIEPATIAAGSAGRRGASSAAAAIRRRSAGSTPGQKLNAILIGTLLTASTASGLYWWAHLHGLVSNSNVDGAIHNIAGVAIIVLVCGHLYMAVLNPGTRHALRGVTTGSVDIEWARQHHPAWLAEQPDDDLSPAAREPPRAP